MHIIAVAVAVIGVIGGILGFVVAATGRAPNDLSLAPVFVLEAAVIIQVVWSLVSLATGNPPVAPFWEILLYLLGVLAVPVIAVLWALSEKDRWSNVVLAVACLTVAVMSIRIEQLWFGA